MAIHDAKTGFHDIKPLPEFHPSALPSILTWLVLALLFATLCYLILRKKPKKLAAKVEKILSPEEKAYAALRELRSDLEKTGINVRDFSNSISEIVRGYLEETFHFPAQELTPKEIEIKFPEYWKKQFPSLSAKHYDEVHLDLKRIFSLCKWISFAKDSEKTYAQGTKSLSELLDQSEGLIRSIAELLVKEKDRTTEVLAENKMAQGKTR